MSSALEPVASALNAAFRPLASALADPTGAQFTVLVRQLGWNVDLRGCVAELPITTTLPPLLAETEALVASLSAADAASAYGEVVLQVIDLVLGDDGIVAALETLDRDLPTAETVPACVRSTAFWQQLGADLPDHLMLRYLEVQVPVLHAAVRLLGLVEEEARSPSGEFLDDQVAYVRRTLRLVGLFDLLEDPESTLTTRWGWTRTGGTSDFDAAAAAALIREGLRAFRGFGLPARSARIRSRFVGSDGLFGATNPLVGSTTALEVPLVAGRPAGGTSRVELGLVTFPVPARRADADIAGLYLGNLSWGAATATLPVSDDWQLVVEGDVDTTGALGVVLIPGVDPAPRVDAGADGSFSLTLMPVPGAGPWRIFGGETGTRMECAGAEVSLLLTSTAGVADVVFGVRTASADGPGITFIIDPNEGGPFLVSLLGSTPIRAELDSALTWSARDGLVIEGGFDATLVVDIGATVGPLTIDTLTVTLRVSGDGVEVDAGVAFTAMLGPFAVATSGIGLRTSLSEAAAGLTVARFGDLGVSVGFLPPSELGFSIEGEVVRGGGYIALDPDEGVYAGALSLQFLAVGLSAVGVLDTELEDNPDEWALFLSLSLSFPQIPLGFGFFLSGVGGIVCLNRTMDTAALAESLKSGACDAVLFPDDPLADATAILRSLDAWFPVASGSTVFGPVATVTWGVPTLVTAELGFLLALPEGAVTVIGSISMVLPDAASALVEIHVDALGAVDPSDATVSITASLYDSTLVRTIHLSGEMAFYARFGDDPYFVLSVGGYHPDFQPPAGLPTSVTSLDRMRTEVRISEDVWYAFECYFALTSNTVQFGAEASFEATARFLTTTYTASGHIGFDVLLVFSPFAFIVDVRAGVSVTAGDSDKELLAVSFSGRLEGPEPWYASGTASFNFFGIKVKFHVEAGGRAPAVAPPRVDVLGDVLAALGEVAAWQGAVPAGADADAVSLAEAEDNDVEVIVRPDAELKVVQTRAPLGRTLDHYGNYGIEGDDTLTVTAVGLGEGEVADAVAWEEALDWFAPAQFDALGRSEKLGGPSFEQMQAGVSFVAEGVSVPPDDDAMIRTVALEYEVRVLDADTTRSFGVSPLQCTLVEAMVPLTRAAPLRTRQGRKVTCDRFEVVATTWCTVDATTGVATSTAGTYRDATLAKRSAVSADPTARNTVAVAPARAALEVA